MSYLHSKLPADTVSYCLEITDRARRVSAQPDLWLLRLCRYVHLDIRGVHVQRSSHASHNTGI